MLFQQFTLAVHKLIQQQLDITVDTAGLPVISGLIHVCGKRTFFIYPCIFRYDLLMNYFFELS